MLVNGLRLIRAFDSPLIALSLLCFWVESHDTDCMLSRLRSLFRLGLRSTEAWHHWSWGFYLFSGDHVDLSVNYMLLSLRPGDKNGKV